jgi:hypothetical protein
MSVVTSESTGKVCRAIRRTLDPSHMCRARATPTRIGGGLPRDGPDVVRMEPRIDSGAPRPAPYNRIIHTHTRDRPKRERRYWRLRHLPQLSAQLPLMGYLRIVSEERPGRRIEARAAGCIRSALTPDRSRHLQSAALV